MHFFVIKNNKNNKCHQVDLTVNADGVASWNGNPLLTSMGGKITSDTLKNVPIK